MENTYPERMLYISLGALLGGLIGVMVADVIAYKFLEAELKELNEEVEDEDDLLDARMQLSTSSLSQEHEVPEPVNYRAAVKPALEALVRPYLPPREDPYVISLREWENLDSMVTPDVVAYYAEDGVYSDVEDLIIDDVVGVLGPNPHLHFGELSEEEDTVYIMNPRLGRAFEVTRLEGSYKELVLGEAPEPPKPKRIRRASEKKAEKVKEEHNEPEPADEE